MTDVGPPRLFTDEYTSSMGPVRAFAEQVEQLDGSVGR
jgi:hypothetical protein